MNLVTKKNLLWTVVMMTLSVSTWGCGPEAGQPNVEEAPPISEPEQREMQDRSDGPEISEPAEEPMLQEMAEDQGPTDKVDPSRDGDDNKESNDDETTVDMESDPEDSALVLPLTIVVLTSDVPQLNSSYNEDELMEMIEVVNSIWSQAEIRFEVRNIVRSPAQGEAAFSDLMAAGGRDPRVLRQLYDPAIIPETGWSMVLLEHMGAMPPGVYFCDRQVLVSARHFGRNNRRIPPNVIAHELGHALGLEHACGQGENLMCADGMSPTLLWEDQIDRARIQAQSGSPAQCADGRD